MNYFTPRRDVMCAIIFLRSPTPRTITMTAIAQKLVPATAKQNVQKYHHAVVIASSATPLQGSGEQHLG